MKKYTVTLMSIYIIIAIVSIAMYATYARETPLHPPTHAPVVRPLTPEEANETPVDLTGPFIAPELSEADIKEALSIALSYPFVKKAVDKAGGYWIRFMTYYKIEGEIRGVFMRISLNKTIWIEGADFDKYHGWNITFKQWIAGITLKIDLKSKSVEAIDCGIAEPPPEASELHLKEMEEVLPIVMEFLRTMDIDLNKTAVLPNAIRYYDKPPYNEYPEGVIFVLARSHDEEGNVIETMIPVDLGTKTIVSKWLAVLEEPWCGNRKTKC